MFERVTFADRLEVARGLVNKASAGGVVIDNGNVRDLLLDNMPRETLASAGDLANCLGFSVRHVAGMVTGKGPSISPAPF